MDKKYVDEDDPWKGILASADFSVRSILYKTN